MLLADEAATTETLDASYDALRERDYDKAASYVAGIGEMSDDDKGELERTLTWMRFTSSGLTGETFDNITVMDATARAPYAKTDKDEDDSSSFTVSVDLDLKKEAKDVEDRPLVGSPGSHDSPRSRRRYSA